MLTTATGPVQGGDADDPGVDGPEACTRAAPSRRGYSLIELTLGILLLEFGVLALVATAGSVAGLTLRGAREGAAALLAADRLEQLRASACPGTAGASAPESGASAARPFELRWWVGGDAALRTLQVAVTWGDRGRTLTALFETAVECPR